MGGRDSSLGKSKPHTHARTGTDSQLRIMHRNAHPLISHRHPHGDSTLPYGFMFGGSIPESRLSSATPGDVCLVMSAARLYGIFTSRDVAHRRSGRSHCRLSCVRAAPRCAVRVRSAARRHGAVTRRTVSRVALRLTHRRGVSKNAAVVYVTSYLRKHGFHFAACHNHLSLATSSTGSSITLTTTGL